ncbi:hypothetical protein GCM10025868_45230 [Angustibacter aerolatus]|uniref:DUF4173 domain-containing protein n=1 Tax=Angustibacter aerolatus TaxID=1162965 RepID=A0ABQ6JML8_9ACTN|nr:DUF4173 domain-containing protein [Angustibacter aerolatus]GMA89273.1 hypothetical protein GCM10025868_45230 [Angustibacter aerolatus]
MTHPSIPTAAARQPSRQVAGALPRLPEQATQALRTFWRAGSPAVPPVHLGLVTAAGLVAALLVVGHRPGLGVALAGLVLVAPAVPALVRRRAVADLTTLVLSATLTAVVAVRAAGWVQWLCVLGAVGTALVATTSGRSVPGVLLAPAGWTAGLARALPAAVRGARRTAGGRGRVLPLLASAGTAVVLVVVLGALFASADTVFASLVPSFHLGGVVGRLVVGVLLALVALTNLHLPAAPPPWAGTTLPAARPARRLEWAIPVLAADVVVLAFVLVQVGALLGGSRHVLQTAGLTYAQYARQGFWRLVTASVLTLAVVAAAARRAPVTDPRGRLLARVALGALGVGTLGVVASALRRMDLYVDAYGLTRTRLLAVAGEPGAGRRARGGAGGGCALAGRVGAASGGAG